MDRSSRQRAAFAVTGSVDGLSVRDEALLFGRRRHVSPDVSARVTQILSEVREEGDMALRRYATAFDGVSLDRLEVARADADASLEALPGAVREALVAAHDAIVAFHREQLPVGVEVRPRPGVRLTRRVVPMRSVGVYAPGGRAKYASSVLMGVAPARIAGVGEIVVCSPPAPDGKPPREVLAACALANADRIFAIGGAGAIAALAFGTVSVPRVDKIVGPGNAYVTEAKRQLNGVIGIDCPAGPSEVLIIADGTADADVIAAELIAQAEHDPDASAVLVATDRTVLEQVAAAVVLFLTNQSRREIIETALASRGALLYASDTAQAAAFAERYAPEHLLLLTNDAEALSQTIGNAGSIFVGRGSSVAFGDYVTGANHVLPTGGLSRAYSGLGTTEFIRWVTVQQVSDEAARELAGPTAALAEAEGLPAHALAARIRERSSAPAALRCEQPSGPAEGTPGGKRPFLRPPYAQLRLYDPGRRPCAIDLSDNTNLFGLGPAVAEVLSNAAPPLVTRYPTVYASELCDALAARFGVAPANVVTACGSDDLIDSAVRAFCEPGDVLAFPTPTFGAVPLFAAMNDVRTAAVALGSGFELEAAPLLATGARLIYLCRPNNPTGTLFDRATVERIVERSDGIVLIDEAYADFAGEDLLEFAVSSDRAVVMRTFSKAYGLAGMRVGFAIGPERLVAEIQKSRGPYKVGGLAQAAAIASLERDEAWVEAAIAAARENRERLRAALGDRGLTVLPSAGNFLLVPVPPELESAPAFAAGLHEAGVAVRAFPALPHVGDCIRVTIGPWPSMQAFLDATTTLLGDARTRREEHGS